MNILKNKAYSILILFNLFLISIPLIRNYEEKLLREVCNFDDFSTNLIVEFQGIRKNIFLTPVFYMDSSIVKDTDDIKNVLEKFKNKLVNHKITYNPTAIDKCLEELKVVYGHNYGDDMNDMVYDIQSLNCDFDEKIMTIKAEYYSIVKGFYEKKITTKIRNSWGEYYVMTDYRIEGLFIYLKERFYSQVQEIGGDKVFNECRDKIIEFYKGMEVYVGEHEENEETIETFYLKDINSKCKSNYFTSIEATTFDENTAFNDDNLVEATNENCKSKQVYIALYEKINKENNNIIGNIDDCKKLCEGSTEDFKKLYKGLSKGEIAAISIFVVLLIIAAMITIIYFVFYDKSRDLS